MESGADIQSVFAIPRRQSPVAILVILLRTAWRVARQAWPVLLIAFLRGGRPDAPQWPPMIFAGLALLSALFSVVSFFRFFFYMTPSELVVERSIVGRRRIAVPFERIQTIHIRQTPLHRFFGVVGLEIDTAGSKGREFSISAIERQQAEQFRETLLRRKREAVGLQSVVETGIDTDTTVNTGSRDEEEQLLLTLSPGDLLKIGVSGNHLQTAGLIFGFLFPIYQTVQDALGKALEDQVETAVDFFFQSIFVVVVLVLPLFFLFSFLLTLLRTVLKYYNLRFFRTAGGFKVESGLLVRVQLSAVSEKIQQVFWVTNPIYRLFNMFALRLMQASSIEVKAQESVTVPGCYREQVDLVSEVYFPGVGQLPFTVHGISPKLIGRRVIFFGILPALVLFGISFPSYEWQSLVWMAVIPVQWLISRRYHQTYEVRLHPSGLHLRYGNWLEAHELLQWYKVQSVAVRQTPHQRRHHLATITFFTAAGSVRIPYLPLEKANALRDYVLYAVESDFRDWM